MATAMVRRLSVSLVWIFASAGSLLAQNGATSVFTMNVDGSDVRRLARVDGYGQHTFPRWSNDSKMVAFDAQPTDGGPRRLFVVRTDGMGLRDLGLGSMPFWSADDKQLAFYGFNAAGRAQIGVQNLDGQGRTDLALGKSACW